MSNRLLLFALVSIVCLSCEKEMTTNIDQIESELEAWEPFSVDPSPGSQIELFSAFSIVKASNGYNTTYAEAEENVWGKESYSLSTTVQLDVVIDSIYLTDDQSNVIAGAISDSADIRYKLIPLKSFDVNTGLNLMIDYHFTTHQEHLEEITNQVRTREYSYSTVSSDTLSQGIVYCEYPLYRQYNYLQDEFDYGYIKTYVRPDFLLDKNLVVSITGIATDENHASDMEYDEALGILKYPMPELQNNTIYRIDFIMEKNGILQKFFRSSYFKTSQYNSFSEKIGSILDGEHRVTLWELYPLVYSMTAGDYPVSDGELLDLYEQVLPADILHYQDFKAYDYPKLVTVQLDTTLTDLNIYGYDLASSLGYASRRPANYIGFRPVNDILYFINYNNADYTSPADIRLNDDEIQSGVPVSRLITGYVLKSYLAAIVFDDLYGFKGKAVNDFERLDDPRVTTLLNLDFNRSAMYYSKHYYHLKYKLPGINLVTFEHRYEFGPSL